MRPDETPEQRDAELQLRQRLMLQAAQQAVNAVLANLGYRALPCPIRRLASPRYDWWKDLDRAKRFVLITQGTIANSDFSQVSPPLGSRSTAGKT